MPEEKESEEKKRKKQEEREERMKEMQERMREMQEMGGPEMTGLGLGIPGPPPMAEMARSQQDIAIVKARRELRSDVGEMKECLQRILEILEEG